MLLVKTKIGPSSIHSIGLFADQFIPKGTIVWKFEPTIDLLITEEELNKLPEIARERFIHYAYFDTEKNKYCLCGDDARFFNHSENPSCDEATSDITTAINDIQTGEELTGNYRTFYGDINEHPEIK